MNNYNTVIVNLLIALGRNMDKPILEKMSFAGANSGNLIFTEGLKDQLDYKKEIWLNQAALKGVEAPSVVIPAANFIIDGSDSLMEAVIRFLDATDCPVTMAGLGAQAGADELPQDLVSRLSETKLKAFRMLSERATSIGVRGEFSAQCLELMGIKNVRVIGCPSYYFRDPEKSYSIKIPSLKRTQITVTPGSPYESLIVEAGKELNSFWMVQMASEFPELAFEQENWDPQWTERIEKALPECTLSAEEIWKYLKERGKLYFDRDQWNAFYKDEDITFAFGSRFHGNMAAFRNGVPALWIVHDMRTTELLKTLHLPHISRETFANIAAKEQLLEYCDYSEYEKHYDTMYKEYKTFLTENGLSLKTDCVR